MLAAYVQFKGRMNKIYEVVMLSDPLEDESRFRELIDGAIERGEVEGYKAYVNETEKSKEARMTKAREEGSEAMEYAKELGVEEKLFGKGKGGGKKAKGEDALMALIQQRQKSRGDAFLENLEAKYAGKDAKSKKGKKRASAKEDDGPSEEAFQRNQKVPAQSKVAVENEGDTRRSKRSKR